MLKKVTWFLFFVSMSVSCLEEPDCFALNNNIVQISFRRLLDGGLDSVFFSRISPDNAVSDTITFYKNTIISNGTLILELNFLENSTTYAFDQFLKSNFLTMEYDSKVQFVSKDCGERFVLSGLKVGAHNFDSVRIVNGNLSGRPSENNIIIYRCPIFNQVKFAFRQLYADTVSAGVPLDVTLEGIHDDYSGIFIGFEDEPINSIALPLNDVNGSTTFTFEFPEESNYITLEYNIRPETLVNFCGVQQVIDTINIVSDNFQFARTLEDSIKDPPVTNVAFFRCPDTDLIRINFKESDANNAADVEVSLEKITADYVTETFYENTMVASVDLPLNPLSDITGFTLDFGDSVRLVQFAYTRTQQVFHEHCAQTLFSDIQVVQTDFVTTPEIISDSITFPINTHVEIVAE